MSKNDSIAAEYAQIKHNFRTVGAISAIVLALGAVFYHFVEKLSWLDSVYFCVITLATVGYGDLAPRTGAGKIFTIFYVLAGVGIIATFANLLLKRSALRRELKQSKAKITTE